MMGIVLGIAIRAEVSMIIGSVFVGYMGLHCIVLGVIHCFGDGVLTACIPAKKIANLDTIEAMRYE
jgi:ABC-type antimicrobial peptide transport system permease subunit